MALCVCVCAHLGLGLFQAGEFKVKETQEESQCEVRFFVCVLVYLCLQGQNYLFISKSRKVKGSLQAKN